MQIPLLSMYLLYSIKCSSVGGLLAFAASLFSFFSIWLRSGLPSERIRGGEYADGHPSHAHYQLNSFRKLCFPEPIKEKIETNFLNVQCLGRTSFVHFSIVLIVKPIMYSFSQYDFTFYFIFSFTYPFHSSSE